MLFLGQSYQEKLFSISFGEVSRNLIPHQIEPRYELYCIMEDITGDVWVLFEVH